MSDKIQYSVIVPVYSGEKTLEELTKRISEAFDSIGSSYEIVYVHDRGFDQSWQVLQKLKNNDPDKIKIIQLTRNFGQHNALICGFEHAIGDLFITMDEDLQHDPSDFKILIEEQKRSNADVVYGNYSEHEQKKGRNILSRLFRWMISKGIPDLYKFYSPFRLINKSIAQATIGMQNSYTFLDGYLSWITTDFSHVKVKHHNRFAGKSSYTINKLVRHSINVFTTFSNIPIRVLYYSGIGLSILSILYAVYILIRKLIFNDLIAGFATINIILGFGFGMLLLGLGILGEYLQKINQKSTKKPNYIVRNHE